MFRNSIQGLEKIFRTDIDAPKVVLVTGPPGSLKTSFTYSLISAYLEKTDECGLYVTLEETADSHLKNMRSLGIEIAPKLEISDFTDLRDLDEVIESEAPTDYLHFVEQVISYYRKKHQEKFTIFALDSLGALYSLMDETKGMRKKMFYFFKTLRDLNLISFIIMEKTQGESVEFVGNELFLADGIIELGIDRTRGKLARYVRVEKMRACEHSMEKHTIEIGTNGLMVLGPTLV